MTKEPNIYRALDFFMIRTPVLPFNLFIQCFPSDWKDQEELKRYSLNKLVELSNDPIIREAIAVASPSLLESLSYLGNDQNARKKAQAIKGFMRYLLRMMTRPTPFGLFSGVTYGQFAEQSQMNIEGIATYRKRVRPDMEWLLKIVDKIEKQREVVVQFRIQRNSLIYRQGERAKIPYVARYGDLGVGESDSVSVRASAVFDLVMEASMNPIPYLELVSRIKSAFMEAELDTIHHYIWQLFEQEFLISELRPPTTSIEPFDHILSVLDRVEGIDELKVALNEIRRNIRSYNSRSIGQGEEQLLQLRQMMNALAEVKTTVQVDLSLEDRSVTLPSQVREDVEKVAHLFSRISTRKYRHLEEYCNEFLEKYGPYREIPILELLDEEIGLGAPATYQNPSSVHRQLKNPSVPFSTKCEQLLFKWFVSCMHQGEQEIVLTNERIQQILEDESDKTTSELIPTPSMELYFLMVVQDREALNRGEYTLVLGPNPGSSGAGKTFGRFIDLMGVSFKNMFNEIHEEEQRLSPGKLLAEISYLPSAARSTNVVLTENFRTYEIGIGTNHTVPEDQQIHVSDLMVGVRDDKFYLKSRKHNCEVIPTAGHMLNYQGAPNVYRFLVEVSQEGYRQWSTLEWGVMDQSPFTPRLRYGNIVLSPATWRIQLSGKTSERESEEQLALLVREFSIQWKVPRYVYMTQFDNRILFDMEHSLHVEEICKDLKSNGQVTLIEHIGGFEDMPIQRSDGRLTAEFVFPLVRRTEEMDLTQAEVAVSKETEISRLTVVDASQRVQLPGGSWFYAKFYGIDSRQDEFIGRQWGDFVQKCREAGVIEQAYFIRYSDPTRHIRVRFNMPSGNDISSFIPIFHEWTTMLLQDGMINKVVVDTYEPEIERYGGPELMLLAERMFAFDSDVTANLVRLLRFKQIQLSQEVVAVCSVIQYMTQFGYNEQKVYELLNERFDVKEYLDDFRNERRLFLQLLGRDSSELVSLHQEGKLIHQIGQHREEAVKCYQQALLEHERQGTLMNNKDDILFSVIHMYLNRLIGIDRDKERKVMIMARHALNSLLQYWRKSQ